MTLDSFLAYGYPRLVQALRGLGPGRDYWTNVYPEDSRRLEAELRRDYAFREIATREIGGLSYPLYRLTPKTQ